ncbi:unannotated protein [freshwater metagenome]|uniref:Unannotated protein n=1 Tax=freshwater metagenome TaxID=449393 RepID=A0A6J7GFC9_9ZZZZ|nr:hypothetical protein [Actinomycetota bacterium]
MSPVPARPGHSFPRAAVPVCALLAALAVAAPAAARDRTVPLVEQPIAATGGLSSIGNGVTAWTTGRVDPATGRRTVEVWTLRDRVPVRVTSLPDTRDEVLGENDVLRQSASGIEAGTASGVPVAVVRTPGTKAQYRDGVDRTTLVRLDTGATRRLPSTIDGLVVRGTAIDAGRLLFTVGRRKPTTRSTSSLWRATATPSRTGKPKKLRTSRRGGVWFAVLADQGRVAIDADEPSRVAYYDSVYAFGTPTGPWRRAARISVSDGPIPTHGVAGFTKGGGALVTFMTSDDGADPVTATRTPVAARGRETSARFGTDGERTNAAGALDPVTGRILTISPGVDGAADVFGFSGVAFRD